MNINILKETLEQPLSQVIGVVEKRQTLPILGNVYIELNENTLTLIGSDLETEITTRVHNVGGSEGKTTVSARKLFDICRSLPAESQLSLVIEGDNKMVVKAGKSRFTLQTLDATDFPRLDTGLYHRYMTKIDCYSYICLHGSHGLLSNMNRQILL